MMEIKKYKCITVQEMKSQIQDSVENKETHEETQGQANHESREASTQVLQNLCKPKIICYDCK